MSRLARLPRLLAMAGVIVTWGGAIATGVLTWHSTAGKVGVGLLVAAGAVLIMGLLMPERHWQKVTRGKESGAGARKASVGIGVYGGSDNLVAGNRVEGYDRPIEVVSSPRTRVLRNFVSRLLR